VGNTGAARIGVRRSDLTEFRGNDPPELCRVGQDGLERGDRLWR